jgi:hypothetical protein
VDERGAEMSELASVVVKLRHTEVLGIDEWKGPKSGVAPAFLVLNLVEVPNISDDQWDAEYERKRREDTLQTLAGWGEAMVEVSTFGAVVGEFLVRPYMITQKQYALLRYEGAA